jgi:hypothetical protein
VFVNPDLFENDEVRATAGTLIDNFGANPNGIVHVDGGMITNLRRS